MSPRDECRARLVQIVDREREVVLIGWASIHRSRALVHEDLRDTSREDRASRPLRDWRRPHELAVERQRRVDLVGEERDLDERSQVAISNSRRTSFSDVLRSVDSLRDPTMSAHGRS